MREALHSVSSESGLGLPLELEVWHGGGVGEDVIMLGYSLDRLFLWLPGGVGLGVELGVGFMRLKSGTAPLKGHTEVAPRRGSSPSRLLVSDSSA